MKLLMDSDLTIIVKALGTFLGTRINCWMHTWEELHSNKVYINHYWLQKEKTPIIRKEKYQEISTWCELLNHRS